MRPTTMLKKAEVIEDLGTSVKMINYFIETKMLNPTVIGNGWKFSQEDILEFQRKYRGYDISTPTKAKKAKQEVENKEE